MPEMLPPGNYTISLEEVEVDFSQGTLRATYTGGIQAVQKIVPVGPVYVHHPRSKTSHILATGEVESMRLGRGRSTRYNTVLCGRPSIGTQRGRSKDGRPCRRCEAIWKGLWS